MRKDIVLFDEQGEEFKRFNLMDVDDIQCYAAAENKRLWVIFLDDGSYHDCLFFEIEVV